MTTATERDAHRAFLNKYYGISRGFYDLTRRYFLLGREAAIKELAGQRDWDSLIEVGPGTGRNLSKLRAHRPQAVFGGVEASDAMLEHAQGKVPFARLVHGFAEDADLEAILGKKPDRVLFAYCLSMVQDPLTAIRNCRRQVSPEGEVLVVDFGDMGTSPGLIRRGFRSFLQTFHVHELPDQALSELSKDERHGLGRYWSMYRFSSLAA